MTYPHLSGCRLDTVRKAFLHLWKDSGKLTHILSTTEACFTAFLYVDREKTYPPYMGVSEKNKKTSFAYFSTSDATYPQIKHSYPQMCCLNKAVGKL